jgi:hypothetical protein
VAWYSVPQSKDDPTTKAKAFFPLCKPYQDWKDSAASNQPSNPEFMWTPLTLFDAMLRAPAKLMDLPAGTHPAMAKPKLLKALRDAHPAVRHLLLMPAHYGALQAYVVATTFKLPKTPSVNLIPGRCKKFAPVQKLPSITINFSDIITAYHAYILNPTGSGMYPRMMRAISQGIDKHSGYQAHTYTATNTLKMSADRISTNPEARKRSDDSNPQSAGATARAVVSPGRPGAPKSLRYIVIVSPSQHLIHFVIVSPSQHLIHFVSVEYPKSSPHATSKWVA